MKVGCELAILITISGIQRLNKLQGVPVNRARRAYPQLETLLPPVSISHCSYSGSRTGIPCASPARRGSSPTWRRSRRRNAAFQPGHHHAGMAGFNDQADALWLGGFLDWFGNFGW